MSITQKAKLLATIAHKAHGDIRKYSGEDYIMHPIGVAEILMNFGFKNDLNLIAGAYCHDLVEDTEITFDFLEDELNVDVSNIVYEVSNPSKLYPDLSRKERKEMDLEHLKKASIRSKALKLADILHNAPTIIRDDPNFAKTWVPEAYKIVEVCKSGSIDLYSDVVFILGLFKG